MKEEERTIYRCGFCRKYGLQKHAIIRHEKYCGYNPVNHHACLTCANLQVDSVRNDDGFTEKTFTCSALGTELHSFKAEKIQHSCLGYTTRMPLKCESYKSEINDLLLTMEP